MVSKIGSSDNINLLQLFKIQDPLSKNEDFEYWCIQPHFEETKTKIYNILVATLVFFFSQLAILSSLEFAICDKTIKRV